MESSLAGRLRNIHLPSTHGLMPVYEAVVNSIESIEEYNTRKDLQLSQYNIDVFIERDSQIPLANKRGPQPERDITGFKIIDNGIGFNDDNWCSFNTLDSLKKMDKGCRGIGRVLWLKAFDNVHIDSSYFQEGSVFRRTFTFNTSRELSASELRTYDTETITTTVHLLGFKERFAKVSYKTSDRISYGLLEHCLWYFIRAEGVPRIKVHDEDQVIDLHDLFDQHVHSSSSTDTIALKEKAFELTHVKIRATRSRPHCLGYCAAGRLVKEEPLKGKIPGLFAALWDADGEFTYMAYLTSKYLDDRVTNERLDFNISETIDSDNLFVTTEISYDDIRHELFPLISKYLKDSLEISIQAGEEKVNNFVSKKAPKYRPLLKHIPLKTLAIDPNIADKDLDLLLHREAFLLEEGLLEEGHCLLNSRAVHDIDQYKTKLEDYLDKATDLKQSDLASYVAHRRVILDLLEGAIMQQHDGTFCREDIIHDLIIPKGATSSDDESGSQNLWLIDERLAFHHYLASDKALSANPTTGSTSGKRPDVASLRLFDTPLLFGEHSLQQGSITVVEIKKPMRRNFRPGENEQKDPIHQGLGYLKQLREGASTVNGRPIPNADKIPGFVYVIADLTQV